MSKPNLLARVATALRVLRDVDNEPQNARAIVPLSYPNFPAGSQQAMLVRTANPGEYKADGATIRARGFNQHPVVHACIRVIADLISSVPLVVLRDRGDSTSRVGDDNPLQQLLNAPAPRFTARQFRSRFAVDYLGYGNAMFHLERTGSRITSMRPINPESLQSVWVDTEGDPRRYDYGNWNGIIVTASAEDVLHFRDLDMEAAFRPDVFGYPRGASAIQSLMADYEAGHYVRQVVTNDGTPTFAVMLSDEATQDDAQSMQDRYKARVVDRGKRGTPAFFGAVKDIKPLGFTLSDLEFPNLRKVAREDICAAFGVDPRMIGVASASNDAGLSGVQYVEARARLVQHTIEPMFAALEDEINHWLAPEFGDVYVAYDHDILRDLVENDEATSKRVRAEFDAGLRTWEESRTALKLSPVPEPTDAIKLSVGTSLLPAAVVVIDPTAVADTEPEDVGTAASDMAGADASTASDIPSKGSEQTIQTTEASVLNGAQISSAQAIVLAVALGQLPRDSGIAMLATFFNLTPEKAGEVMGSAGLGTSTTPNTIDGSFPVSPVASKNTGDTEDDNDSEASEDEDEDEDDTTRSEPDSDLPMDAQGRPWWVHLPKGERPVRAVRESEKYAFWQRQVAAMDASERTYYSTARSLFTSERKSVGKAFGVTARRAPSLAQTVRKIQKGYAKGGEYYEAWERAYTKLIGPTFVDGAQSVAAAGFDFTLASPEVQRAIVARAARLAELVGEETSKQVTAAVLAGEKAGMSVTEIGRLVQASVYGEPMTEARAMRIARTESAGAQSQGAWEQARAMGDLYVAKEWLSFEDGKTRETHLACSAQGVIAINDAFAANGMQYPLDPAGDAGEIINCRCVLTYYDEMPG